MGWGWGYVHMVSGAKLKYTKLMGFLRLPWMMGKGWGLWVVGKKEKGRMKKKKKKDEQPFFWFSSSFLFRL